MKRIFPVISMRDRHMKWHHWKIQYSLLLYDNFREIFLSLIENQDAGLRNIYNLV